MSFVVFSVGVLVGALVCFGMRWFFFKSKHSLFCWCLDVWHGIVFVAFMLVSVMFFAGFVRWLISCFLLNFIDYGCCMFCLFYCLSSVLCWIVVVALIGVLVSWLVRWLVRCFFQTTILITVVFCFWLLSMLYLVFFLVWCFDLILFYWTI